ncbi:dephospho-CoA kinase [Flammeovirga yaeyamensis]|uniref:Dephospho-CoA kinase n=1 Tax=Flammeovirga yaeyamensis TaxID=367791 RepID=A0AAX1N8H8_9BACT|nr:MULTISPECIES: dephospho-CoA kinase [Flammeovirga]ANQ50484.1 dephospho-CoA kinase [Flammeovirga sp. MY04]MBB3700674.1 dephospho-CoA kinase [Flammeovirga yaeyamensis]NMF37786.1 dephospho-CoA kinase [Flammeovirga yaeyamensis]QWG02093.1 dephospho-CoA kinase [Flammeovirga yaeyamensis]
MQVGITGGIGAGKSYICRLFKVLGVPIYNADNSAKMLMVEDSEIIDLIKSNFGEKSYFPNGMLNRKYLASEIFSDQGKLNLMNEIVHPRVKSHYNDWVEIQLKKNNYIIKEAALMFTNDHYKELDKVIVVKAPYEDRIKRVLERDKRPKQQIEEIIKKQKQEEELSVLGDYEITNDDSKLIIPQVIELHRQFCEMNSLVSKS